MPNTSPGAIGDTEATGADQNPVADTSTRELEVDPDKARLWLDDPTLDRIIDAVGPGRPHGLDRDMLTSNGTRSPGRIGEPNRTRAAPVHRYSRTEP